MAEHLQHVAIIMDGNSRWSKKHNLSLHDGYTAGVKRAEETALHAAKLGITHLTLYAFSTENWQRDRKVVECLLGIFSRYLDKGVAELIRHNISIRFIGDRAAFSRDIQDKMAKIEQQNCFNPRLLLQIAMNYGGREEIEAAAQKLLRQHRVLNNDGDEEGSERARQEAAMREGAISPLLLQQERQPAGGGVTSLGDILNSTAIPAPDLLIRSGGEQRLSNFMLWHLAYTELYFCDTLWPDFSTAAFDLAVADYEGRTRKYGR